MSNKDHTGRSGTTNLGDALKKMLETYELQEKFNETRLIGSWEAIMGKPIASRTHRIFIHEKKLFVELTSAPLKHELSLSRSKILELFNREIGQNIIEEIVIL